MHLPSDSIEYLHMEHNLSLYTQLCVLCLTMLPAKYILCFYKKPIVAIRTALASQEFVNDSDGQGTPGLALVRGPIFCVANF